MGTVLSCLEVPLDLYIPGIMFSLLVITLYYQYIHVP